VGAAPFYARLVEIALREVDKGVIEATRSMGARLSTLVFGFYCRNHHLHWYRVLR
jgi:D-methionine transport system permease protein